MVDVPNIRRSRIRLSPSFRELSSSSVAATRVGRANRKRDTQPELLLRRELWRLGLRYRLHASGIPGNPDLVFASARAVVFVDGDFWHGRRWRNRRLRLAVGANAEYWIAKIERNRARDRANNRRLKQLGWQVIRVWETEVRRDPSRIAATVLAQISLPNRSHYRIRPIVKP